MDKFLWHPITAAVPLIWFAVRIVVSGATGLRVFGLAWMCMWFGLAVYNHLSGGRYLRWVDSLGDDDESSTDAPGPGTAPGA